MKNRIQYFLLGLLVVFVIAAATPISFLKLMSDADGNQHSITNLASISVDAIEGDATNQFAVGGTYQPASENLTNWSELETNVLSGLGTVGLTNFANSNVWLVGGNSVAFGASSLTNIVGLMNTGATEATPLFFAIYGKPMLELGYMGFPTGYAPLDANLIVNPLDALQNDNGANPSSPNQIRQNPDGFEYITAIYGSSILGGGSNNIVAQTYSASGLLIFGYDTILGGYGNIITNANYATVAGTYSFARHDRTFVWSSGGEPFTTTASNQFLVNASNGVGINTNDPGTNALKVLGNVDASGFTINGAPPTFAASVTNISSTNVLYPTFTFSGPTNSLLLNNTYQLCSASGNCAITNVTGTSSTASTWATLIVSNSTASVITLYVTIPSARKIGTMATNSLSIGAGKLGITSVLSYGQSFTQYWNSVEP